MIDGMPAFPDEIPDSDWCELRLGTPAGMITLRKQPSSLSCVVWGNADSLLVQDWHRVIWACAAAGYGQIETPAGTQSASEFASLHGIPDR